LVAGAFAFIGGRGALDGVTMTTLNLGLGVTYLGLTAWGLFSVVMALLNWDETGWQVQVVSYVLVATLIHYSIVLGGSVAVGGDAYPVRASLYRVVDIIVAIAASTLIIFFLDTTNLFASALAGCMMTSTAMLVQLYKVGAILQGIANKTRDEATGKLLSEF